MEILYLVLVLLGGDISETDLRSNMAAGGAVAGREVPFNFRSVSFVMDPDVVPALPVDAID